MEVIDLAGTSDEEPAQGPREEEERRALEVLILQTSPSIHANMGIPAGKAVCYLYLGCGPMTDIDGVASSICRAGIQHPPAERAAEGLRASSERQQG